MFIQRKSFALFIIAIFLSFSANSLFAIDFPKKPITIVVGFGAGGTTDLATRGINARLSKELGVPVAVINKPGTSGVVGGQAVVRSKPDGYTIHTIGMPLPIRQAIDPKIPFDILSDFEAISMFVYQPMFTTVRADSKFKTIDDLIEFGLANPGKLIYGTPGYGSGGYFTGEILKANTKIVYKHVPFTSDGKTVIALMGGHIDCLTTGWGTLRGKVKAGTLRVLLSFGEERIPEAKDVPTVIDKGWNQTAVSFFGFVAPRGTPKEIIEKLDNATRASIQDPEVVATYNNMGFFPSYKGPAEFKKFLKGQLDNYTNISKAAGITLK